MVERSFESIMLVRYKLFPIYISAEPSLPPQEQALDYSVRPRADPLCHIKRGGPRDDTP
jgi:hypothetical protein